MKTESRFESQLWNVLAEERLTDLSQFHQRGFFDEVPLYSRISQVFFLEEIEAEKANQVLLAFGLKFLNALLAYDHPRWPFLAALTVWDDIEEGLIVPNVFVCSGAVKRRLNGRLELRQPAAPFARHAKKWLALVDGLGEFQALEDNGTLPDAVRVVIGRKAVPQSKWMIPIDRFAKAPPVSRRQRA